MKNQLLTILMLFALVLLSCKDDDCENAMLTITDLETEYGCEHTEENMDIDLTDDFTIIRSQSGFDNLVEGDCQPTINFSIYDLVIGKKGLTNGYNSIDYQLIEDCNTGDLKLHVTFKLNDTLEAPYLTYHALIPKLNPDQNLTVEILIN